MENVTRYALSILGSVLLTGGLGAAHPLLFDGASDSVVSWAVGSSEGTRTPEGGKNQAYYGHTDPGDNVWNVGSFSVSCEREYGTSDCELADPSAADAFQLRRLQRGYDVLSEQAIQYGMELSIEELVNGVDLYNQSQSAALGWQDKTTGMGYVYWIADARKQKQFRTNLGTANGAGIIWARVQSYRNTNGDFEAGGLRGVGVEHDQTRRATRAWEALHAKGLAGVGQEALTIAQYIEKQKPPDPIQVAQAPETQRATEQREQSEQGEQPGLPHVKDLLPPDPNPPDLNNNHQTWFTF